MMQNILSSIKICASIALLVFVFGCESDDNSSIVEGTNSIVNYLEENPDFSLFSEAVDHVGLSGVLDGNSGTYTVLAPDDDAMQSYLDEKGISDIDDIPEDSLRQLVNYHILDKLSPKDNFVTSYVQTLAQTSINDSVNINLSLFVNTNSGEVVFNGNTEISEGDIPVDNGILHRVNHVLELPTLKTFMKVDDNLTPFYNAITENDGATDFEDLLSDPDKQTTIFVPNEVALNEFFNGPVQNYSDSELDRIYRYHLLDSLRLSSELQTGYLNTRATETYSGENYPIQLYVDTQAGLRINDTVDIVIPDITTINGNIEVVDGVMQLPTVGTFVKADARFDSFDNMLTRDDQQIQNYEDLLAESPEEGNAPFTVFAPINKAFNDLLEELFPDQNAS